MNKITTVSEIILKYESDFNGHLKSGYNDDKEFLRDLTEDMKTNEVNEVLEYYRTDLKSRNNTNSTSEQRKELEDIILILEGQSNEFNISI